MKLDNILGKIVALTKEIKLKEPQDGTGLISQFRAGGDPISPFMGGIGLTWWRTERFEKICKDIAAMSMEYDPNLKYGNMTDFCDVINNVLQKNALDSRVFNGHVFFHGQKESLYDIRSPLDVNEFANLLWQMIRKSLSKSLTKWLVVYPLPRINTDSFELGFDGIRLLNSRDISTWKDLAQFYSNAIYWSPEEGKSVEDKQYIFEGSPPNAWLLCEIIGSGGGARKNASKIMRQFISVLLSYAYERDNAVLMRSAADTTSYCIQFPATHSKLGIGQTQAHIGQLLHPMIVDMTITFGIKDSVVQWYEKHSLITSERMNRATNSALFINYGINADELEKFLHYFIALDALYGERNNVENRIKEGVSSVYNDIIWDDKIDKLFDLRSELVHGGISGIDEWQGLDHYEMHFKSRPEKDVEQAAISSLKHYVTGANQQDITI